MKILDTYLTRSYNQGENVPWESLKYLIGEVRNILCLVHTTQLIELSSRHAVHTTQLFGDGSVHDRPFHQQSWPTVLLSL